MIFKHTEEQIKYQGTNKKRNYFEGWYFKHVSADLKNIVCVIPGISFDRTDSHSFIQVLIKRDYDGKPGLMTEYYKYSVDDFSYTVNPFCLAIGNNKFKSDGIELDLNSENLTLKGSIEYSGLTGIKRSFIIPNAMGCFAYLPIMECYHDIISMNHKLTGSLLLNNEVIELDSGSGYMEKDWGSSFPKKYVWLQCNNFENKDASIMCSIAHIPFLGTSFQGFICNISFNNQEYRFASYNLSKILEFNYKNNMVSFNISKGDILLNVKAYISEGGMLKAPKNGKMDVVIKEGLTGSADVSLSKVSGEILFKSRGNPCAIEIFNINN